MTITLVFHAIPGHTVEIDRLPAFNPVLELWLAHGLVTAKHEPAVRRAVDRFVDFVDNEMAEILGVPRNGAERSTGGGGGGGGAGARARDTSGLGGRCGDCGEVSSNEN